MLKHGAFLALTIMLLGCPAIEAVERRIWTHEEIGAFDEGEKENASVSSRGVITLSHEHKSLLAEPAQTVFDVLATDEAVYAATGNEGKLYRLSEGKTDVAEDVAEVFFLSLARDEVGNVFAGTGPEGTVYRLDEEGRCEIFAKLPAKYVWALAIDAKGRLVAATGDEGKVFQISSDGKVQEILDAEQSHVMCLTRDDAGNLYAGADEEGIVYRISPDGEATVAYDALEGEIRAIAKGPGGTIYFGTADIGASGKEEDKTKAKKSIAQELLQKMTASQEAGQSGAPVQRPPEIEKVTGKNVLYRMEPSGHVLSIAEFPKKVILALAVRGEDVYVGTGFEGYVYRVDANRDVTEVAKLEKGQVTALAFDEAGRLIAGTANEGQVLRMLDGYVKEGVFTGTELDAGNPAAWGKVTWFAQTPKATSVTVATRSGNSSKPDGTWSPWSRPLRDADGSQIASPPARFLQYRVMLGTAEAKVTPVFRTLEIAYLVANLPPRIASISVAPGQANGQSGPPSRERKESRGAGEAQSRGPLAGSVQVTWSAEDPNSDELSLTLEFRGAGETNWKTLAEELEEKEFAWDTTLVPDGMYELRLTASDAPSNTTTGAKRHEKVSELFRIDNTPPVIEKFETKIERRSSVRARATVTDASGRVRRARYSVDSGAWENLSAKDGITDSPREELAFEIEKLSAGEHTLVLLVEDDAGNSSASKKVLSIEGEEE